MNDLPSEIPSDGREIWDWASKFSNHVHTEQKKRDLLNKIHARLACGDCYFWMKSRDCPNERNVKGQSKGPSCSGYICGKFQQTQSSKARIGAAKVELAALGDQS